MIGDPEARGRGVGTNACIGVMNFLKETGNYSAVYTRYLSINDGSKNLFKDLGFIKTGNEYKDKDGLTWQNATHDL